MMQFNIKKVSVKCVIPTRVDGVSIISETGAVIATAVVVTQCNYHILGVSAQNFTQLVEVLIFTTIYMESYICNRLDK
jgi:hypothetical protein